ncbi:MAG: phosphate uptake regulator PhoU [Candidatus Bathyarchaeota archaeon]|nr:phosphate uptake regulator PhoU [Candidatus Bathyarchaeota archaeon]
MGGSSLTHRDETRRLQITGGSTYILSLPKRWITQNQLTKGSALLVHEEEDGSLSIIPSKLTKPEKQDEAFIRVSAVDKPEAVTRKAVAAYLVGYNTLHVKAQGQQQLSSRLRNYLKNFARHFLVGTEIVTDTPTDLVLQVLLNYPELSVQSALRRMAIITASMHKDAVAALKNLDYTAAKAVIETDNEVDRFNLYIIRLLKLAVSKPSILKEIGLNSAKHCLGYRLITKSIERTADHATKIAENVLTLKEKVSDEFTDKIEKMSEMAIGMFEDAIEALFKGDFNLAETVIEKISQIVKLEKDAVAVSHKFGAEEIASLSLLIESIRRTAEYASDIAEIVLNMNVESVIG